MSFPHSLSLAPHVRACRVDDQVILLDLRSSRYLSVGGPAMHVLADHVQDWPHNGGASERAPSPDGQQALISRLMQRGLLTAEPQQRRVQPFLGEATSSLGSSPSRRPTGVGQLTRFLRAAAAAALSLRFRSLDAIAASVAARHQHLRVPEVLAQANPMNVASAFEHLRPFGFSAEDRCLHDSLALMNFLSSERATANWVIGVKTQPFGAHSWVQLGSTVLNDQHEQVRRFTPILIV